MWPTARAGQDPDCVSSKKSGGACVLSGQNGLSPAPRSYLRRWGGVSQGRKASQTQQGCGEQPSFPPGLPSVQQTPAL